MADIAPRDTAPLELNRQFPILLNYLIVSVMMVCVAVPVVDLLHAFLPAWNGSYLLAVVFVVGLESLYASRTARRIPFPSRAWFAYRGTELVVILVLLKLLLYLLRGFGALFQDLQLWQQDFFYNFFTGEYLGASILVLAVWVLSQQFNTQLMELEADDETLERERRFEFRNDRGAIRQRLMLMIVLIGLALVAMTVMTRAYLRAQGGDAAAARVGVLNLLVYILLGLLLLSQTRLAALRALWYRERATISRDISGRWVAYGLVFLAVLAVLASLLPTRYSMGLLDTLRYALSLVVLVVQFLLYLILALLTIPLNWLYSLLGRAPASAPPPPPPPQPPAPPPATPTSDPLLDLISSLIFWAILAIVVGYSLVHFLGRHQELTALLRRVPVLGWLAQIAQGLWGWLRQVNRSVADAIDSGLRRLRPQQIRNAAQEPARFVNLRRMSPRARVQYFYLAMVRRGGQRGLPRHPSQTPGEYAHTLEGVVPEVNSEIDALTESFVEARYSQHDVTPEQAGHVQSYWERVKQALRARLKRP